MPNPYEMTALEDPSAMYDELPRGGGRIVDQSGDVRSFQFQPPSIEERDAAIRQAAQQEREFNAIKNAADEARYYEDLISQSRVQSTSEDVASATKSMHMAKFKRDFEIAKSKGLSPEESVIQSIMFNPGAFGSGSAGMVNALKEKKRFVPQPFVSESGKRGWFYGDEGQSISWEPGQGPEERGVTPIQNANYWLEREKAMTDLTKTASPNPTELEAVRKNRAQAERALMNPPSAASLVTGGDTGTILPWPKSQDDLEVNALYEHPTAGVVKFNGKRFIPVQTR